MKINGLVLIIVLIVTYGQVEEKKQLLQTQKQVEEQSNKTSDLKIQTEKQIQLIDNAQVKQQQIQKKLKELILIMNEKQEQINKQKAQLEKQKELTQNIENINQSNEKLKKHEDLITKLLEQFNISSLEYKQEQIKLQKIKKLERIKRLKNTNNFSQKSAEMIENTNISKQNDIEKNINDSQVKKEQNKEMNQGQNENLGKQGELKQKHLEQQGQGQKKNNKQKFLSEQEDKQKKQVTQVQKQVLNLEQVIIETKQLQKKHQQLQQQKQKDQKNIKHDLEVQMMKQERQEKEIQEHLKNNRKIIEEAQKLQQKYLKQNQIKKQSRRKMLEQKKKYQQKSENLPNDRDMSKTQIILKKQYNQYIQKKQDSLKDIQFDEFMFELNEIQEFYFHVPVQQQIILSIFCYLAKDNTYVRIDNIDETSPVQVFISQNSSKLVAMESFYYQKYISFQSLQNCSYHIRFSSSNSKRLIALNLVKMIQKVFIDDAIKAETGKHHALVMKNLQEEISRIINSFKRYWVVDYHNLKQLAIQTSRYYYWQIFQMIFIAIFCCWQIRTINRLLQTQGKTII